jgi:hypothetical protein
LGKATTNAILRSVDPKEVSMETSNVSNRKQKRLKTRLGKQWLRSLCNERALRWLIKAGIGLTTLIRVIQALISLFKS